MPAGWAAWLAGRDPGLWAVKRSVRAAVVMPAIFAIGWAAGGTSQLPLFASFGAFSLLLMVDLGGARAGRLAGYTALIVTGMVAITAGSLCSGRAALAVTSMAAAAFVILFAGVLSPVAGAGSMYLLLAYVLPVSVPAPPGQIPARLAGWALAAVIALPAILLIWPRPWRDARRAALAGAVERLAVLVQAHADGRRDPPARAAAGHAVRELRDRFTASPFPPTGAGPTQAALAMMVSRVEWAGMLAVDRPGEVAAPEPPAVRELSAATAATLRAASTVIAGGSPGPARRASAADTARLTTALAGLQPGRQASLARAAGQLTSQVFSGPGAAAAATAFLGPVFQARTLSVAAGEIGALALESAGRPVPPQATPAPVAGRGGPAALGVVWQRAAAHLSLRSVWLRNSLRGAAALAAAVAVTRITGVSHGFWVALGTMSVLRSNALGTGATALRAVAGTVAGFAAGTAIMLGLGAHQIALWLILPPVVLVAGIAPAVISFAAGQAGFTVMVIILFNILAPIGWSVGLVRVEDVALGCAVSVGVGLLLWPRGATAAFGQALRDAYRAGSGYLVAAVDRLVSAGLATPTQEPAARATATYRRLEDSYRQFLAERGAKVISLRTATHLLTGAARLRLAAQSLATLPLQPLASRPDEAIDPAAASLRAAFRRADAWYGWLSGALAGDRAGLPAASAADAALPAMDAADAALTTRLTEAFAQASAAGDEWGARMAVRLLWACQHLADEQASQRDLAGAAEALAAQARRRLI